MFSIFLAFYLATPCLLASAQLRQGTADSVKLTELGGKGFPARPPNVTRMLQRYFPPAPPMSNGFRNAFRLAPKYNISV